MADEPRKPRIRRRRIIERPRLIHALDRSGARVRMLIAGSGYGKTTLLEQWAPRDGRRVGWFRARQSAADVAVVARALATASEAVVAGAGRRLLERLSVTQDPEREATLLAEMLAEELEEWPGDGWIVIDDYQHLAASGVSERFVQTVVDRSPVGVVIASRVRPSWVRPRSILDGTVLEIPQSALAMSADEIDEILQGARSELTSGLVALAGGWPAVVGLAGMAGEAGGSDAVLPETLYEYFADELYRGLDPAVRSGLAILAAMPLVDRELAATLLGEERAELVCGEALALGILEEREGRLELHPLVRTFLGSRGGADARSDLRRAPAEALSLYRERREWDPAFELVRNFDIRSEFAALVVEAIDETVNGGRLLTMREWIQYARSKRIEHPAVALAEVEVHLRHGKHLTALTLAKAALENLNPTADLKYRLMVGAARAAHVGSCEEEALSLYQGALSSAQTREQEREARWGELMCTAALERPEAHALLDDLERSAVKSDIRDQVRMADKQLLVGFRFGFVRHLAESRRASELVDRVDDPFVRCSFRSQHAWALALGAYYDDALSTARALIQDATEYRVEPALPYGFATEAVALAGLSLTSEALVQVELAHRESHRLNDANGVQNAYAIRTRILLQEGETAEACASEPPDLGGAVASMRGEVLGSRALALASIGRIDEAVALANDAAAGTKGIEAHALLYAVRAVCALKSRSDDLLERCEALLTQGFDIGSVDFVVTAYRANPELLATILTSNQARDRALFLVRRARDDRLLGALGLSAASLVDPAVALSAREREVYDLVCEGLTNAEIARHLFIATSTVKVHVHHVFDKLGIRSRTALALNSARGRYATPIETRLSESPTDDVGTTPKPEPLA
jgi:ATP/maltotriose-dependent transcriptional regulator MalT